MDHYPKSPDGKYTKEGKPFGILPHKPGSTSPDCSIGFKGRDPVVPRVQRNLARAGSWGVVSVAGHRQAIILRSVSHLPVSFVDAVNNGSNHRKICGDYYVDTRTSRLAELRNMPNWLNAPTIAPYVTFKV